MLSVKAIYDGKKVILLGPIPTKKKLSAVITLFDTDELQDMAVETQFPPVSRPDTKDGRMAMQKLCQGLGKGPADLATNHDHYLYANERISP